MKILTVSRLSPPKRVGLLVEAMQYFPEEELTVVGGGEYFEELEQFINSKKIGNVILKGEIPGFNEFHQYDLFALISDSEGLPFSAMEAMYFGLPLILSDVGGCSSLIDNNGELVNNTVLSIKKGIQNCKLNHLKYSLASKKLFNEKFNLKNKLVAYTNYYDQIMTSKKSFWSNKDKS